MFCSNIYWHEVYTLTQYTQELHNNYCENLVNVGMTVTICKVESLEKQVAGGPVFDSRTACQFGNFLQSG